MNKFRTGARGVVAALVLALVPGYDIARADEAPKQYDIELLVFRNLVQNDGGEVWRDDYADWFDTGPDAERSTPVMTDVEWLGESARRLDREAAALRSSAQYRPIAHFAWRQTVLDRDRSLPVQLPAGGRQAGGAWVDGSARVAVERYLHLYLDIQLHMPAATGAADNELPPYPEPRFELTEQRRMRSNELHYFDNPRFGVLAMITPYKPPAAPAALPAATPTP